MITLEGDRYGTGRHDSGSVPMLSYFVQEKTQPQKSTQTSKVCITYYDTHGLAPQDASMCRAWWAIESLEWTFIDFLVSYQSRLLGAVQCVSTDGNPLWNSRWELVTICHSPTIHHDDPGMQEKLGSEMALKTHKYPSFPEGEMQFWNDILVTPDAPVENKRPRDSHNFERNLVVLGIGVICIVLLFKLWKSEQ